MVDVDELQYVKQYLGEYVKKNFKNALITSFKCFDKSMTECRFYYALVINLFNKNKQ